jgi:hypothetical protein
MYLVLHVALTYTWVLARKPAGERFKLIHATKGYYKRSSGASFKVKGHHVTSGQVIVYGHFFLCQELKLVDKRRATTFDLELTRPG